jgi:hypothetical protein
MGLVLALLWGIRSHVAGSLALPPPKLRMRLQLAPLARRSRRWCQYSQPTWGATEVASFPYRSLAAKLTNVQMSTRCWMSSLLPQVLDLGSRATNYRRLT